MTRELMLGLGKLARVNGESDLEFLRRQLSTIEMEKKRAEDHARDEEEKQKLRVRIRQLGHEPVV